MKTARTVAQYPVNFSMKFTVQRVPERCRERMARFTVKIFATTFLMFSTHERYVCAWYWRDKSPHRWHIYKHTHTHTRIQGGERTH